MGKRAMLGVLAAKPQYVVLLLFAEMSGDFPRFPWGQTVLREEKYVETAN